VSRKRADSKIPKWDDAYHSVPQSAWGKSLCAPCHDTAHGDCLGNPCDCHCRERVARPRKPKGASAEQTDMSGFGTIDV
jgi:hypothetical protein